MTGPSGPGHVTTGMGGLDMTKRNRDLVERGAAPSTSGSGQVTGRRAVTFARGGAVVQGCGAHLACRISGRAQGARRNAWPAVVFIPVAYADHVAAVAS